MNTNYRPSGVSVVINSTLTASKEGKPLIEKQQPSPYSIKIANTLEEREEVYRMAYQIYLEKGYIKKNSNEWLVLSYDADDETVTIVVKDKDKKIVGAVSLVFDGPSKLPAQKIYSDEINKLKANKERIVEISRLVINPEYRNSKEILVSLINYLFIYSKHVKDYSCLVIQVNPRHTNYYKKLLSFVEIGGEKPCPSVQNAPATLLYLPITKYYSELHRCQNEKNSNKKERSLYGYFIKPEQENLVSHYLKNQMRPMRVEEKNYFGFSESGISRTVCI